MTQLEIVLSIAFGVQFLSSVSLAIKLRNHERKLQLMREIINQIGFYLSSNQIHRHDEEREYGKSKSKVS